MLEVKPNKEILKIHTYWMGVTPFQAACMVMGLITGSIAYYFLPIPEFIKAPVVAPIVVLFCSLGFFTMDGMNLFQIVSAMFQTWRMYRHPLVIRGRKEDINGTDNNNK
ncbi:MAG: hypothetical protein ACI4L2_07740 [Wujia sp.]